MLTFLSTLCFYLGEFISFVLYTSDNKYVNINQYINEILLNQYLTDMSVLCCWIFTKIRIKFSFPAWKKGLQFRQEGPQMRWQFFIALQKVWFK